MMSKFSKICCILGGIVFAIGIILCIVGFSMGYSWNSNDMPRITSFFSSRVEGVSETVVYEEAIENAEAAEIAGDYSFSKNEIKKLDLNVRYGSLSIETHESDDIIISMGLEDSGFACEKSGETLMLEDQRKGFDFDEPYVIVFVPQDMIFEEIHIEIGAGEAIVNGLNGANASIAVGAGALYGNGMSITEKTEIEVGVGSVQLFVPRNEDNYNYNLSCGIGTIRIGGNEYTSVAGEKRIDNNSEAEFIVECGVGEVVLDFYE